MLNYNYSTVHGSNLNIYPELFYFTPKGWRFNIYAQFAMFKRGNNEVFYYTLPSETMDYMPTWNGSFNMGFGIRKEFGIPIPGTSKNYTSVEFVSFYDLNGDGIKDRDEIEIENIVIRINKKTEVITDAKGRAAINNIEVGTYIWTAFSLEQLDGWFPNIGDSLQLYHGGIVYVPFTKGVRVSGNINIDKEKWSAFSDIALDLSRIRITAANHKVYTTLTDANGNYSFYLPKGTYTLTLDENILGNRFQLLQNNISIEVSEEFDNLNVPFYIVEKRRAINTKKF
jgi:hypothetical protein